MSCYISWDGYVDIVRRKIGTGLGMPCLNVDEAGPRRRLLSRFYSLESDFAERFLQDAALNAGFKP